MRSTLARRLVLVVQADVELGGDVDVVHRFVLAETLHKLALRVHEVGDHGMVNLADHKEEKNERCGLKDLQTSSDLFTTGEIRLKGINY